MPRNPDLPKSDPQVLSKRTLLLELQAIDNCDEARARVLRLEVEFRRRITDHVTALPAKSACLRKFNTSPFVLMFYAKQKGYAHVSEIEKDILPAKLFSSLETSAGRMIQDVVLPVYGWQSVESTMHSARSAIDGRRCEPGVVKLATPLHKGCPSRVDVRGPGLCSPADRDRIAVPATGGVLPIPRH
ncbi:MAG: hypothetical protein GXP31_18565 [Kiritimatiellaeota bacterium]|nr:hypothetical protein [Kiritimatiellota bacterium]